MLTVDDCGGILTDQQGQISYKDTENGTIRYERCVWTILGGTSYYFALAYDGFTDLENEVISIYHLTGEAEKAEIVLAQKM